MVLFVLFVSSVLFMAAGTFPDLAPGGQSPATAIPQGNAPTFGAPRICSGGDWPCAIVSFFTSVGNGLATAFQIGGTVLGMFFALLTFRVPALQGNIVLQFLNLLLIVPILTVLFFFIFRVIKGIIPTVGGDTD